jgi:hypothetical protein
MHMNSLCACSCSEAMKGQSSLTSCHLLIFSRLSASPVWAQLTLIVPAWGTRSLSIQNGAPFHRVRAHSLTGIQNSNYCIGMFLDLRKAFDTCSHEILLKKLYYLGIQNVSLDWFRSYLTDRFQKVDINGTLSNVLSIVWCIPRQCFGAYSVLVLYK